MEKVSIYLFIYLLKAVHHWRKCPFTYLFIGGGAALEKVSIYLFIYLLKAVHHWRKCPFTYLFIEGGAVLEKVSIFIEGGASFGERVHLFIY